MIRVGPGREYRSPSDAARIAHDGDVIEIDAASYLADAAVWTQSNLTLKGVGGRPHLNARGASAQGKGTWVIQGDNVRVENLEFSGSRVPDKNGAGIRLSGRNLVVVGCLFHDNENGILVDNDPEIDITIESSEFADNGAEDGQSHNIYAGRIHSLVFRNSYSHHARIGHTLKSRARNNQILYSRFADERDGRTSLLIDLPEGGYALVMGSIIQQGPLAENSTLLSYGEDLSGGATDEKQARLYVINNTFVNDREAGVFVRNATGRPAQIYNNIFAGQGQIVRGSAAAAGNLVARPMSLVDRLKSLLTGSQPFSEEQGAKDNFTASEPGFMDREGFDYRLKSDSSALDLGVPLRSSGALALVPEAEYNFPGETAPRHSVGRIDLGAFEFVPSPGGRQ